MIRTSHSLFGPAALAAVLTLGLVPATAGAAARPFDASQGSASHSQRGGARPDELGLERVIEKLGLDAETRTQVLAVLDAARTTARDLRFQIHQAHEELRVLLDGTEPDEASILTEVDTLGALELELRKHEIGTLLEVRALLTDEQETTLQRLLQRRAKRGGRR